MLGRDVVVSVRDMDKVMDSIIKEITSGAKDGTITCSVADVKCVIYEKKRTLDKY